MRIFAIVTRIMNQFRRDKRTLALLFIAPLLLLTLLHYLFQTDTVTPKLAVSGLSADFTQELKKADLSITKLASNKAAKKVIDDKDYDAVIRKSKNKITITFKNDDPNQTKEIIQKFQRGLQKTEEQSANNATKKTKQTIRSLEKQLKESSARLPNAVSKQQEPTKFTSPEKVKVAHHYVYGDKDTTFFDTIAPVFIGFFVFFFVFLIAGISFLRERTTGTLERLMVTPIKRVELELGYLIGFGIFAIIQSVLVVMYAIHVLDMIAIGSVWYVLLVTLLLAFVSMSLGMLLSAFASSEFQIIQFIPIVIVPQVLFCGIFPIEGMADWLQWLAHVMPFYYGADALQAVMIEGKGFQTIQYDIYILLGFAVSFLILNMFALKKYRKM